MSPIYLTVEQIIAINADQDGGVGVRDLAGVESNAHRPQSGAFGQDAFPDVWSKAAAYVHGFASTQHFFDGNKRTAWFAAMTFLRINGYPLPDVPTIEAETFVQAVAQNVFTTDDEPDATVEKAAEWFRSNWENQPSGRTARDRLQWAAFAMDVESYPSVDGVFDVRALGAAMVVVESLPALVELHLIARIRFFEEDLGHDQTVDAQLEYQREPTAEVVQTKYPILLGPPPKTGHPHHEGGIMPASTNGALRLRFNREGTIRVVLTVNGKLLAKLPFTLRWTDNVGADDRPSWLPGVDAEPH